MHHGIIKVAAATPAVRIGDCVSNAAACAALCSEAAAASVKVLVFPELCLTGATCGDLLSHSLLLRGALDALMQYAEATAAYDVISVVGLPVAFADRIYNCAAVVAGGQVLGLVPKTRLAAAERRVFSPAPAANLTFDALPDGSYVPLGPKQVFVCTAMPALRLGVELGGDAWATIPPAARAVSAGATVICHPAALPDTVGSDGRLRATACGQSVRLMAGYVTANAGPGESTTDFAFGGQAAVAECGELLSERPPFSGAPALTVSDLDLERILHDRRLSDFDTSAVGEYTENYFTLLPEPTVLDRVIPPHPFIPDDAAAGAALCERVLAIQSAGLSTRMTAARAGRLVIGISGGLDSTLALLVATRTVDALGRDRRDILAVTMPCFGTSARTKANATALCRELGVELCTVDIADTVIRHFRDIGHDPAVRDVTYENAQARERTRVLMDMANQTGGLVVGTGDLSELALGFATYNGDHMSMYAVNAGVPKTVVRHVVAHVAAAERAAGKGALADVLLDILDTPVSPELLPADQTGEIAQRTEELIGPYELHDFFLYYLLRYGYGPQKLLRLSEAAYAGRYDTAAILSRLETFTSRFFSQQFKRSCLPDGPTVFDIGVSPRASLAMPSDAAPALWWQEIQLLKEQYL